MRGQPIRLRITAGRRSRLKPRCLGRASSLAAKKTSRLAVVECVQAKTNVVDQRLNVACKGLQARIDAAQHQPLLAAQRLWVQYRVANCSFPRSTGRVDPTGASSRMHTFADGGPGARILTGDEARLGRRRGDRYSFCPGRHRECHSLNPACFLCPPCPAVSSSGASKEGAPHNSGLMFWLSRNRLVGSYLFFSATSRWYFSGP